MVTSSQRQDEERRAAIRQSVLEMGVRAEAMIRMAVRSVIDRDLPLGRRVIASDEELDRLERLVDARCLEFLAARPPVASELRFGTITMKIVTDLERIGDLAVGIAERGLELGTGRGLEPDAEIQQMSVLVAEMVRAATDAYGSSDGHDGLRLRDMDKRIDALDLALQRRLLSLMIAHPDQAPRGLSLVTVVHRLERAADHAVNIGELVAFAALGHDPRHRARS